MATKSFKDTLLRGIALLGLIVILVLGAWGIILLAFNLPSFLGGVSDSISGLFVRDESEEVIEEEEIEVPVVVTPAQPSTPSQPTTPSTPGNQPTYVYTPATYVPPQLYGTADLKVSVLSVVPQGNRYVMQFMVQNAGTNIAQSGWNFNAILPIQNQYTYTSPGQQALNPGDKIVYTLGFDRGYNNYPYDYDYNDSNDERFEECGRNPNWDADEWFDWYQDAFDTNSDAREDWDEDEWEEWYDDFCDDNNYDRHCGDIYGDSYKCSNSYNYNTYPYNYSWNGSGTVTVHVDPHNRVYEQNEYNNSASWNLNW